MDPDDARERVRFATQRLDELLALNNGNLPGGDAAVRQQLIQEFFFHLAASIEVLAQIVNETRGLGIPIDDVTVRLVLDRLPQADRLKPALAALYVQTRGQPLPADPYSDEGLLFRLFNYRNHVTHRYRNPFFLRVGSLPPASLILDPRLPTQTRLPSIEPLQDELTRMRDLVSRSIDAAINTL
jgi:hypothetical protein